LIPLDIISLENGWYDFKDGKILYTGCKDRLFVTGYKLNKDYTFHYDKLILFFPKCLVVEGGSDKMRTLEGMVIEGLVAAEIDWENLYDVTEEYSVEDMLYYAGLHKLNMI